MAKSYNEIYNSAYVTGNIMDWTNALTRLSGVPVDITEVYDSYKNAVKYAAENPVAYEGQVISVTENGDSTVYVISPASQGKITIDGTEYNIYLKEVGTATNGDNKSIDLNGTELSIHGFKNASVYLIPQKDTSGKISWVSPDDIVKLVAADSTISIDQQTVDGYKIGDALPDETFVPGNTYIVKFDYPVSGQIVNLRYEEDGNTHQYITDFVNSQMVKFFIEPNRENDEYASLWISLTEHHDVGMEYYTAIPSGDSEVHLKVNISSDANNTLEVRSDGLFVSTETINESINTLKSDIETHIVDANYRIYSLEHNIGSTLLTSSDVSLTINDHTVTYDGKIFYPTSDKHIVNGHVLIYSPSAAQSGEEFTVEYIEGNDHIINPDSGNSGNITVTSENGYVYIGGGTNVYSDVLNISTDDYQIFSTSQKNYNYTVEINRSNESDNAIELKSDGLYVKDFSSTIATIESSRVASVEIAEKDSKQHIILKDAQGTEIASADASIFTQDSFLNDVEYDATSKQIKFTWAMADGSEKTDSVDVQDFVQVYAAGNGLKLDNNQFSIDENVVTTIETFNEYKTKTINPLIELVNTHKTEIADLKTASGTQSGLIQVLRSDVDNLTTKVADYDTIKQVVQQTSEALTSKADSDKVYTKDEVNAIIGTIPEDKNSVIEVINAEIDRATKAEQANTNLINILVGSDTGKTARAIATEVVDAALEDVLSDVETNTQAINTVNNTLNTRFAGFAEDDSVISVIEAKIGEFDHTVKVATTTTLGSVKASEAVNKINVDADGLMEVNSLNVDKLVQTAGTVLILDGGNAKE